MEEINLRNYAYLGDAIWESFLREKTIRITNNSKKLHQITTNLVKTSTQCELLHFMQSEYRQATAFEALIGWWHTHDKNRLKFILNLLENQINI